MSAHVSDPPAAAGPIRTARLELLLIPEDVLRSMVDDGAGDAAWPEVGPIPAELVATIPTALRLRQIEATPEVAPWLVRAIVVDDATGPAGQRVVGHVGGHGRPDAQGVVEAGYTVTEGERGQGVATEAAAAWFEWAHAHGARRARLSTTADNGASRAVIARLGLRPVDRVWDEDDQVWEDVFEADLPLPTRGR